MPPFGRGSFAAGGLDAPDDYTVVVHLEKPKPGLFYDLGNPALGIVPQEEVERLGEDFGQRPVGSGPFQFESWKKDDQIVLAAFPDYWAGRPYLDRVTSRDNGGAGTRELAEGSEAFQEAVGDFLRPLGERLYRLSRPTKRDPSASLPAHPSRRSHLAGHGPFAPARREEPLGGKESGLHECSSYVLEGSLARKRRPFQPLVEPPPAAKDRDRHLSSPPSHLAFGPLEAFAIDATRTLIMVGWDWELMRILILFDLLAGVLSLWVIEKGLKV
ncbi:MAG: hypothetical protein KM310_00555 [Clostridiales bacterium]|nr:hypothetical protein [Clostridiales bacterium]